MGHIPKQLVVLGPVIKNKNNSSGTRQAPFNDEKQMNHQVCGTIKILSLPTFI